MDLETASKIITQQIILIATTRRGIVTAGINDGQQVLGLDFRQDFIDLLKRNSTSFQDSRSGGVAVYSQKIGLILIGNPMAREIENKRILGLNLLG